MKEIENILHDLSELEIKPEEKEDFNLGFFDMYQFDSFITSLDRRSDEEIISFIRQNLYFICNKIIQNQWEYPDVLLTEKFLRNFCFVVSGIKDIDQNIRIAGNKICYDFSTLRTGDEAANAAVMNVAKLVNRDVIIRLRAIELSNGTHPINESLAANLALCRYSSVNEKINIRRLNFVMCTKDVDIMTLQVIVFIYEIMFDRLGQLFKETMWEYYTPEQEIDFGNDFLEIYSTISLAVLTLVNNLPTEDITRLIKDYVSDWEYLGCPPVRFSLISLSADYSRIQNVVEYLTTIEKIYVP